MIKKLLCLILIFASLLSLVACGPKYAPVPSTDEEARVIMTFELDGEKYELKYELYRAFFLTYKIEVDGGEDSVWTSDGKESYIKKIDEKIISAACDIFSVLHVAKKLGFDPYSKSYDDKILELIEQSVDGGISSDGSALKGFSGDYDAYLESLKDNYLNYSVSELLIRYSLAYSEIISYYKGTNPIESAGEEAFDGALDFDDDDVLKFYEGEDSVRVLLASLDSRSFSEKRASEIRDQIAACADESEVMSCIIGYTATTEADATNGMLIGRHSLDPRLYGGLTQTAFSLDIGETGEVLKVYADNSERYYILYRTEKTEEYFESSKSDIYSVYEDNEIGKIINEAKDSLVESVHREKLFDELDRANISMK